MSALESSLKHRNPPVRVWRPIYYALKEVGRPRGVPMGDLLSAVMLHVLTDNPAVLKLTLVKDYGFTVEEAERFYRMLADVVLKRYSEYRGAAVEQG